MNGSGGDVLIPIPDAPVAYVYGQLMDLIRSRALRTITLNDVFA